MLVGIQIFVEGINISEQILAIQILAGFLESADSKCSILDPFTLEK